jgi:hypothetical protein
MHSEGLKHLADRSKPRDSRCMSLAPPPHRHAVVLTRAKAGMSRSPLAFHRPRSSEIVRRRLNEANVGGARVTALAQPSLAFGRPRRCSCQAYGGRQIQRTLAEAGMGEARLFGRHFRELGAMQRLSCRWLQHRRPAGKVQCSMSKFSHQMTCSHAPLDSTWGGGANLHFCA